MTASILQTIVATKKQEIASLPNTMPKRASGPSFIDAILQRNPALIAEIKPKSPCGGHLLEREDVPELVRLYTQHAQAISVLCDETYFGGGFDLLREVRSLTDKPLLAKEFIIDPKQINHAAKNGASAILLIANILEEGTMSHLAAHAITLGLDVLLEVHTENDVRKAVMVFQSLPETFQEHVLFGINNRHLDTLEVDLAITSKIAPLLKKVLPTIRGIIAESGIKTRGDIEHLQPFVQGFLIGTSILQAEDPALHFRSLFAS